MSAVRVNGADTTERPAEERPTDAEAVVRGLADRILDVLGASYQSAVTEERWVYGDRTKREAAAAREAYIAAQERLWDYVHGELRKRLEEGRQA